MTDSFILINEYIDNLLEPVIEDLSDNILLIKIRMINTRLIY